MSKIESVFDALQDGIIILDMNNRIVRYNRWVEQRYKSKPPITGEKCHKIFHDHEEACGGCPNLNTLESGKSHKWVVTYPAGQSPEQWFEISMTRLDDSEGKQAGAVLHIKDITELKRAELLLKDEANRRRLLVEHSRDGIVVLEESGKVFEANSKYAKMLGYTMEEVQGLYVWDWEKNFSKEQLLGMLKDVDNTGDHFTTRHIRKDGSAYDVEISTNGTVYAGKKLVFCVCRDITERKRVQREREELISNLQNALSEIKTLRDILPICSFCKKIRDDKGYWEQVEVYISKHMKTSLSHGVCPDCMRTYYPLEYAALQAQKKEEQKEE